MKLIAEITYASSVDYEYFEDHQVIPFEADSREAGLRLVEEAVARSTDENSQVDSAFALPGVFGEYYGPLDEHRSLDFKVLTLEEWFDKNKKEVNMPVNLHNPS